MTAHGSTKYLKQRLLDLRKKVRKAKRRGPKLSVVVVKDSPIPDKFITNCKYGYHSVSSVVNSDLNKINLNSLFDPDLSAVGHQPYGFDQLAALYNRYRVISATVNFTYSIIGGTSSPFYVSLIPTNDTADVTSDTLTLEHPEVVHRAITISRPARIKKTYYPSAIIGVTDAVYKADDRYQSVVTTSPAETVILHQVCFTTAGAGTAGIDICGTIEYHVEFFDRLDINQS